MVRSGSAYRLCGALLLAVALGGGTLSALPLQSLPATGPLRKLSTNGRYFTDGSGKAVYLTGSHSWDTFQRWLTTSNPAQYLDLMQANNLNYMRFWVAD